MTVVLIVFGILAAIAVVNWGPWLQQTRQHRAGAAIDRVLQVEQQLSRDWGSYSAWPADLDDVGGDLSVLNGQPSTSLKSVSAAVGSKGTLTLAVLAGSGDCVVRQIAPLEAGGTSWTAALPAESPCNAKLAFTGAETALTQTRSVRSTG